MYITKNWGNLKESDFDWETYFSVENTDSLLRRIDPGQIVAMAREHLKEDKFQMTLILSRVLKDLLQGMEIQSPRVLELGAATGFLTRWIINQYGGTAVLVDKCNASFKAYNTLRDSIKDKINYRQEDIFQLETAENFDIICSFGLIEHFEDKKAVLEIHKKFVAPNGIIIILVPLNSPLSRTFLEVHPELNLGYRELLSEKEFKNILICEGFQIIRTTVSHGYSYDFVGAVCRIEKH